MDDATDDLYARDDTAGFDSVLSPVEKAWQDPLSEKPVSCRIDDGSCFRTAMECNQVMEDSDGEEEEIVAPSVPTEPNHPPPGRSRPPWKDEATISKKGSTLLISSKMTAPCGSLPCMPLSLTRTDVAVIGSGVGQGICFE